jgi:hypothetical protein
MGKPRIVTTASQPTTKTLRTPLTNAIVYLPTHPTRTTHHTMSTPTQSILATTTPLPTLTTLTTPYTTIIFLQTRLTTMTTPFMRIFTPNLDQDLTPLVELYYEDEVHPAYHDHPANSVYEELSNTVKPLEDYTALTHPPHRNQRNAL